MIRSMLDTRPAAPFGAVRSREFRMRFAELIRGTYARGLVAVFTRLHDIYRDEEGLYDLFVTRESVGACEDLERTFRDGTAPSERMKAHTILAGHLSFGLEDSARILDISTSDLSSVLKSVQPEEGDLIRPTTDNRSLRLSMKGLDRYERIFAHAHALPTGAMESVVFNRKFFKYLTRFYGVCEFRHLYALPPKHASQRRYGLFAAPETVELFEQMKTMHINGELATNLSSALKEQDERTRKYFEELVFLAAAGPTA
jgi:hypothetical protein